MKIVPRIFIVSEELCVFISDVLVLHFITDKLQLFGGVTNSFFAWLCTLKFSSSFKYNSFDCVLLTEARRKNHELMNPGGKKTCVLAASLVSMAFPVQELLYAGCNGVNWTSIQSTTPSSWLSRCCWDRNFLSRTSSWQVVICMVVKAVDAEGPGKDLKQEKNPKGFSLK